MTRVAIVTGAGGGIGRAVALALAEDGLDLVLSDFDPGALAATAGSVVASVGADRVRSTVADLTAPTTAAGLVDAAIMNFRQLDVIVNCAGVLHDARLPKMTDPQFDRIVDINLIAPMRLLHAADGALRESPSGRVVLLGSRVWLGGVGSANYAAAKGGLSGLTRSLALELAPCGATVNCLAPGFIETTMTDGYPPEIRAKVIESVPVGRVGTPADVVRAVRWLVAPDAGYVTGQTHVVCGGRSLSGSITKRAST